MKIWFMGCVLLLILVVVLAVAQTNPPENEKLVKVHDNIIGMYGVDGAPWAMFVNVGQTRSRNNGPTELVGVYVRLHGAGGLELNFEFNKDMPAGGLKVSEPWQAEFVKAGTEMLADDDASDNELLAFARLMLDEGRGYAYVPIREEFIQYSNLEDFRGFQYKRIEPHRNISLSVSDLSNADYPRVTVNYRVATTDGKQANIKFIYQMRDASWSVYQAEVDEELLAEALTLWQWLTTRMPPGSSEGPEAEAARIYQLVKVP